MAPKSRRTRKVAEAARRYWATMSGKPAPDPKLERELRLQRRRLEQSRMKVEVYRRLVTRVFARQYNKSREAFPDLLDALPGKYSPEWEADFTESVETFEELNLKPVPQLLEACGFGTEKWEKLDETGLTLLTRAIEQQVDSIVDQVPEGAPPGVAELMRIEREEELPHLILEDGDDFEMVDETVGTLAAENAKLKEEVEEAVLRIKAYQEQLERLQRPSEPSAPGRRSERLDGVNELELTRENEDLRKQLRARDNMVSALRDRVEKFEREMSVMRERLMDQIRRLERIVAGDVPILPSEDLSGMEVDDLLGYARNLAAELGAQKRTLEEGIQGMDAIRTNYEESRSLYRSQQEELQEQIERMSAELDDSPVPEQDQKAAAIIDKQRQQLELLSNRIRGLNSAKSELDETIRTLNSGRGGGLQSLDPLRNELAASERFKEALVRHIRENYDANFAARDLPTDPFDGTPDC